MSVHPVLIAGQWRRSQQVGTFHAQNPATGEPAADEYPISAWADCDAALTASLHAAHALRTAPRGRLRLYISVAFGLHQLPPVIPEFMRRYPEVELDITVNDREPDFAEEGIDIAVRSGEVTDESLIARRICLMERVICAAPSYLKKHGVPRTPDDLLNHNCLLVSSNPNLAYWPFDTPQGLRSVKVNGNVTANNAPVSPYAYTVPLPRSSHRHDYSGRADWRLSDNDLVYSRYHFNNFFFGRSEEVVGRALSRMPAARQACKRWRRSSSKPIAAPASTAWSPARSL